MNYYCEKNFKKLNVLGFSLILSSFIAMFLFVSLAKAAITSKSFPLHFNFGNNTKSVQSDTVYIKKNTLYRSQTGYGLLREANKTLNNLYVYGHPNKMLTSGIESDDKLEFRIDLNPGRYLIEVHMAKGKKAIWKGEIKVNQNIIADNLIAMHTSFEGESPPPYWSILEIIPVEDDHMLFSIDAENQTSTVCGISVYKYDLGPLINVNNLITAVDELSVPNAELAIRLINNGKPQEAQKIIEAIPENLFRYEKSLLLLALAGRLEYENPRPIIEWAVRLLNEEIEKNNNSQAHVHLKLAQLYILADYYYKLAGWDWTKSITRGGIFIHVDIAGTEIAKLANIYEHPLYHQALWYLGKVWFWIWAEQHAEIQLVKADSCFTILNRYYPDHRLLNMYLGKNIHHYSPAKQDLNEVPAWVASSNKALKNILEIIHYWVDNRQAENGEFGGKYDDDVEMLRFWPIARMAVDDQKTLRGMRRLVDGIWNSDWIAHGFSSRVRDVEHAAEPVADTQPMMIGLDYGNPIYVERCMESMRGLQDLWTGINQRGHRHFKSSWYSSTAIDDNPPRDCDLPMNTRTVKAARWLAWYNHHPVIMKFLIEWADAWLEDCLRTDKGKPYGIVPSAIRFHDDAIGGHADNWHHPELFWHYFNFQGGFDMLNQFLAVYQLTADERYLQPVEEVLKLLRKYLGKDINNATIGSEEWVVNIFRTSLSLANMIETWRLLTGNTNYDDVAEKYGSNYLKFRLTGNKNYLVEGSNNIVEATKYNRELVTTEAYFTDRVYIKNLRSGPNWGSTHLESIYTGNNMHAAFYPFYSVTWNGMAENFVAIVLGSSQTKIDIHAYNLDSDIIDGSLTLWRLKPGKYEFIQGPDENEDGHLDTVTFKRAFPIDSRSANCPVELPSRSIQLIKVRQIESATNQYPSAMADIAITENELLISEDSDTSRFKISIPVHNIGIIEAVDIDVELRLIEEKKTVLLEKRKIDKIEAPLDLKPRLVGLEFIVDKTRQCTGIFELTLNPGKNLLEITYLNNNIIFDIE